MAETHCAPHSRRTVLAGAGVLALAPLAATIVTAERARAASAKGRFDFDKPLNRLGTDSVRWDYPVREHKMSKIVAGMGVADMDFRCAPAITRALKERIAFPSWGYEQVDVDLILSNTSGMSLTNDVLRWNKRRYKLSNIRPEIVGFTSGVMQGLVSAMQALSSKGDKVLVLGPTYTGFHVAISFAEMVAKECSLQWVNGRYEINWEGLERQMTPDVKVSILCNPHNPTGRVWTREELTRYGELCKKNGIIVLVDEIHSDIISTGQRFIPYLSLKPDIVANSIIFNSGSKSFSLAAMKCGWFFTTNPTLYRSMGKATFPSISNLSLLAQQVAYNDGEEWLDTCVEYINDNLEFAHEYINRKMPLIRSYKPEGTYLMWLDISELAVRIGAQRMVDTANARRPLPINPLSGSPLISTVSDVVSHWIAERCHVALDSGTNFGRFGDNFVRMNVATPRVILRAALDSIAQALSKLS